jgi:TPP-dependent indolepyruvate ferredoxin oxidoreductase alpha subunit
MRVDMVIAGEVIEELEPERTQSVLEICHFAFEISESFDIPTALAILMRLVVS